MLNLFKSSKCYNGGNQHNFQPRYDEKSLLPDNVHMSEYTLFMIEETKIKNITKTYVKDVCVWCGKTIKR